MIFLGIDTSTSCGSVALVEEDRVLAEWSLNQPKSHSERLLPGLARLLESAEVEIRQVDVVAAATGPGSFTGLRIGLATAKALAMAASRPMVGVPTLDLLAENVPGSTLLVCPALDARKGQVFAAFYRSDAPGGSRRISDYLCLTPEALAERLIEPTLLIGDGALLYRDRIRSRAPHPVLFAPLESHYPRASALCRLARQKYEKEGGSPPGEIRALYVRPSDAELKRSPCH
ncbi:MAG: tRNA (adenosine(37)-N6)-threonylcarbamoyltransferase complex dimerization subunit type 1 TsaB [bacterium]